MTKYTTKTKSFSIRQENASFYTSNDWYDYNIKNQRISLPRDITEQHLGDQLPYGICCKRVTRPR